LNLENGKQFTITTKNLNDKNIYIQQIKLNGIPKKDFIILHDDIMKGGTLEFVMGAKPKK
jgi:putative alpha-1,2-mannosidase